MAFQSWCSMTRLLKVELQDLSWAPTLHRARPSDSGRKKLLRVGLTVPRTRGATFKPNQEGQGGQGGQGGQRFSDLPPNFLPFPEESIRISKPFGTRV